MTTLKSNIVSVKVTTIPTCGTTTYLGILEYKDKYYQMCYSPIPSQMTFVPTGSGNLTVCGGTFKGTYTNTPVMEYGSLLWTWANMQFSMVSNILISGGV